MNSKESLLINNLSAAAASLASHNAGALLCSCAVAGFAVFLPGHPYFGRDPGGSLFEGKRHVVTQIRTALDATPAAPAATARPKQILESKELAKNIVEILKNRAVEIGLRADAGKAFMAVGVINLAFLNVAKNGVGLGALAKAVFGLFLVLRAAVGVPLEGSFPVGSLDFINRHRFCDAENFVIIALVRLGHIRCSGSLLCI